MNTLAACRVSQMMELCLDFVDIIRLCDDLIIV